MKFFKLTVFILITVLFWTGVYLMLENEFTNTLIK